MEQVHQHADHHGVQLIVSPTADAVATLTGTDLSRINAILHVTC